MRLPHYISALVSSAKLGTTSDIELKSNNKIIIMLSLLLNIYTTMLKRVLINIIEYKISVSFFAAAFW